MGVVLNRERLESALIDVTGAVRPARSMPSLAVGKREKSHEFRQLAVTLRRGHQVKVVRHDAVREKTNGSSLEGLGHDHEECPIVAFVVEEPRSSHTSIEHMKDNTCGRGGFSKRHDGDSYKPLARNDSGSRSSNR